jgi:hypothetical protein
MASLPSGGEATEDIRELYADSIATAETALNLYRLQLLLKDLTLHPDGAVDLGGQEWRRSRASPRSTCSASRTWAPVPRSACSATGGTYRVGLRGDLKLGDVIEANAAPSWFVHRDGRRRSGASRAWAPSSATSRTRPVFSLVVGGVIDLQRLVCRSPAAGR